MPTARELTDHLARLMREEHGALADFIRALAAFDREKRWRELGHTSLFSFLHRELELSKGAAHNRKTAAELVQAFPEVEKALREGDLCLSTVTEVAKVLTPENRAEVLPRFFGLSRREAEAVTVSLRPAEVVPSRDVVGPLRVAAIPVQGAVPAPPTGPPALGALDDHQPAVHVAELASPMVVAGPVGSASARPAPAAPARAAVPPPPHSVELLDPELARMHVTVSRRFLEKLEAARDALGHACPGGGAAEILERGLDLILARDAKRKGLGEKPREVAPPSSGETIPAHVKRASRESGVKGAPIRGSDAFAFEAGRLVRVQGCDRGRSSVPRDRRPVGPRRSLLTGAIVEFQRIEFEAGSCFPDSGAPRFQQGL